MSMDKISIPTDTMEQWAASEIRIATKALQAELAAAQQAASEMSSDLTKVGQELEAAKEQIESLRAQCANAMRAAWPQLSEEQIRYGIENICKGSVAQEQKA